MSTSTASGKQVVGRRATINAHEASAHWGLQVPESGFLNLPRDIRYMVYGDVGLLANVRTETINPKFDIEPFITRRNLDHLTPGYVQGYSLYNVEYKLDTAILGVNRQVHVEASDVFRKNSWAHITVNVSDFSAQLREAGFEVLTPARAQYTKSPALEVKISFNVTARGDETFFWPLLELPALCHALSLTTHYDTAELTLTISETPAEDTKVTHQEAREWELVGAFTETIVKPREMWIFGYTSARIAKWLQNFDGSVQPSEEVVMKKITDKLDDSNMAIDAKCWQEVHDKALSCQGLIDVALKCDVDRQRYENLVPSFPTINSQCTSNIVLARLKLGNAKGALEKCLQIGWEVLPPDCLFNAHLRKAMAAAASRHFIVADSSFKAAYKMSPSHPQLREELEAFEQQLLKETDEKKGIKSNTPKNLSILQGVKNLLAS